MRGQLFQSWPVCLQKPQVAVMVLSWGTGGGGGAGGAVSRDGRFFMKVRSYCCLLKFFAAVAFIVLLHWGF